MDRRLAKEDLRRRLRKHFEKDLPLSIQNKLTPVEYNVIISSFVEWLYSDRKNSIELATMMLKLMTEEPTAASAITEPGFLKELDKL